MGHAARGDRRMDSRINRRPPMRKSNLGLGLIEVLIAVAILAFGMLGIAALQATALRNGQSSYERSQAVTLTYSILERMRTNIEEARNEAYNMPLTCDVPEPGSQAQNDLRAWIEGLHASLGGHACGAIDCTDATTVPSPPQQCDITIQWDDSRGTAGSTSQALTTSTAL